MLSVNAARAAPVVTGRDPQTIDRAGSAIGMSRTTPADAVATGCDERTAYLLAELRCVALRARLLACEVDAIGVALRGGLIDPETAIAWLRDCGVLEYVTSPQGDTL